MRAPRVQCPACGRLVALMPTRRAGYGIVHDHKKDRRSLQLCEASMQQLPLSDAAVWQDSLPGLPDAAAEAARLF
ncbi:hypothetical protein [Kitasatospora azatica]|uniref:hypothetical protein n=1 Tax=Kitasatospora azatica TaxID=58347 RepID=UPI00055F03EC|nr:hypothetical protein [Kitasatospora azatica]